MTFYVQKDLPTGAIRFGVSPRLAPEAMDRDPSLSTGPAGQFLRRMTRSFFFSSDRPIGTPALPGMQSVSTAPLWSSLRPDGTRRGFIYLALFILGALLVLLGLIVVARKGPQGWIEVLLGATMIAAPIVQTAQKRRRLRQQEQRARAERQETEQRQKGIMTAYANALEHLRSDPSAAAIEEVGRAREGVDLPYDIWSPVAKRSVLHIGFMTLERLKPARAKDVAELMDRASAAAGLSVNDETETKIDLYKTVIWHLLADDRMGDVQAEQVRLLSDGLGVSDRDTPAEAKACEEFQRLRGLTRENLPRTECSVPLEFREHCIHTTRGQVDGSDVTLTITNRRFIVAGRKEQAIPLMKIDDVEVDVDRNRVLVRTARPSRPIELEVDDPIYTAALLDLATTIDERPRSFA